MRQNNTIEEDIVLRDVFSRENLLWSFLLMWGYLRQSDGRRNEATGKKNSLPDT
jgi:hypothetical protein